MPLSALPLRAGLRVWSMGVHLRKNGVYASRTGKHTSVTNSSGFGVSCGLTW